MSTFRIEDFREWHPKLMKFDSTLIAIAPSNNGKTTFVLDCLDKIDPECGMMVCTSPEWYKTYAKRWPPLFCHGSLNDDTVSQIYDIMGHQTAKEAETDEEWENLTSRYEQAAKQLEQNNQDKLRKEIETVAKDERWTADQFKRRLKRAQDELKKEQASIEKQRTKK